MKGGSDLKPVVGVSFGFQSNNEVILSIREGYVNAIQQAGGIPVLLPPQITTDQFQIFKNFLNGILLSGGGDVDPVYFKEEPNPFLRRVDPLRDKFELDLIIWAIKEKIPILGICRGMQILNIACGGTVIQHLVDNKIKHTQDAPYWYPIHSVILTDRIIKDIFGRKTIRVNSFHHQSIGRLGTSIIEVARASDGVIEAIVKTDHPFALGVQWHPERMYNKYPGQKRLFQVFVQKCEK